MLLHARDSYAPHRDLPGPYPPSGFQSHRDAEFVVLCWKFCGSIEEVNITPSKSINFYFIKDKLISLSHVRIPNVHFLN